MARSQSGLLRKRKNKEGSSPPRARSCKNERFGTAARACASTHVSLSVRIDNGKGLLTRATPLALTLYACSMLCGRGSFALSLFHLPLNCFPLLPPRSVAQQSIGKRQIRSQRHTMARRRSRHSIVTSKGVDGNLWQKNGVF